MMRRVGGHLARRREGASSSRRIRPVFRALGAVSSATALLLGPWMAPGASGAERPGYYKATAQVQGFGFFATFPGSLINPILSGASPLAATDTDWVQGVSGTATVVYPGALPLVYQDALLLVAPQAAPVQPLLPRYPLIVQGSSSNRAPEAGAPAFDAGPVRGGPMHMSCSIPEDDSGALCQARAASVRVGAAAALAPVSGPSADVQARLAAFRAWRSGLLDALWPLRSLVPGVAERPVVSQAADESMVSVQSLVAQSSTSVGALVAKARSALTMQGVSLLGGVLQLDSLVQYYESASDHGTPSSSGGTQLLGASLGGVPVRIDPRGVTVAEQPGMGKEQIEQANRMLADALAKSGLIVRGAQQRDTSSGTTGSIGGDGLFVQATMGFQADGITTGFWLGTGNAQADAGDVSGESGEAPVAPAGGGEGATSKVASPGPEAGGIAASSPMLPASAPLGEPIPATDAGISAPGAPVLSASVTALPVGAAPPATRDRDGSERAGGRMLEARRAASVTGRATGRGGLGRATLVGLVGVVQALGLAALAAFAWRTRTQRQGA